MIDVDPSLPRPRLCFEADTHEPEISYAALSYCWGKTRVVITTSENYDEHIEHGFDETTLPQTIQDAMRITRELGVRYLWVDALCIIQGSYEYWQKESATMASIYGNAFVIIVAVDSDNSFDGIFPKRELKTTPIRESADGIYDRKPILSAHRDTFVQRNRKPKEGSPWPTRAWTLREIILSPRALMFTGKGMH